MGPDTERGTPASTEASRPIHSTSGRGTGFVTANRVEREHEQIDQRRRDGVRLTALVRLR